MKRRTFVSSAIACGGSLVLAKATPPAKRVSVTSFGADPSGAASCNDAVRKAIAALRGYRGTLVFPNGRYRFGPADGPIMAFQECHDLDIDGDGSALLFSSRTRSPAVISATDPPRDFTPSFQFTDCRGVSIHDFSVDYPRPPFSQGKVIAVGRLSFDLRVDPEFPVTGAEPVDAFADYDPKTKLMAHDGVDSFYNVAGLTLVAPQTLRVALKSPVALHEGALVLLRHPARGSDVFMVSGGSDFRFSRLKLFAAPGMGIMADRCDNIGVDDLQVDIAPNSSRLMSLNVDAVHFADCSGSMSVTQCRFRGMGDDAINCHSLYFKVKDRVDRRTVAVGGRGPQPVLASELPHATDQLRLFDGRDYREIGKFRLEGASVKGSSSHLTFTQALPPEVGPGALVHVCNRSPVTTVRDCRFLGNRARAILVHENADIVGNTIEDCSLAGILLICDSPWQEGPPVRNVRIEGNRFSHCSYSWPHARRGVITLDKEPGFPADAIPKVKIHRDVRILNNVFGSTDGAAVYCVAASNLKIAGNRFDRTWLGNAGHEPEAVILKRCGESEIDRNTSAVPQAIKLEACDSSVRIRDNVKLTSK